MSKRIYGVLTPFAEDVLLLAIAIKKGFDADPGTSELDDEQPIHVSITLGDYRRAVRLYYKLKEWEEEL